jgi:hypothetical protein
MGTNERRVAGRDKCGVRRFNTQPGVDREQFLSVNIYALCSYVTVCHSEAAFSRMEHAAAQAEATLVAQGADVRTLTKGIEEEGRQFLTPH